MISFPAAFYGGHTRGLKANGLQITDRAGTTLGMSLLPPGVYAALDVYSDELETAGANARLWASAPDLLAITRLLAITVARFHHFDAMSHAKIDEQMERFFRVPVRSYTPRQCEAADRVFTFLLGRAGRVGEIVDRLPDTQPVKGGGS